MSNECFSFVPAYGKVFLVRKRCGIDEGKLYAMKVLKKASIVQKLKTAEHTRTERQVNNNFHKKIKTKVVALKSGRNSTKT